MQEESKIRLLSLVDKIIPLAVKALQAEDTTKAPMALKMALPMIKPFIPQLTTSFRRQIEDAPPEKLDEFLELLEREILFVKYGENV